jgi:hypothetical protein
VPIDPIFRLIRLCRFFDFPESRKNLRPAGAKFLPQINRYNRKIEKIGTIESIAKSA